MLTVLHCAQRKIKIRVNNVMLPPVSPHIYLVGALKLTIHVVQNRPAGEQKSHWDKTNKGNYHLKLCMPLFVLSQCDFCSPVWRFCTT